MDACARNVTSITLDMNLHKDTPKVWVVYRNDPNWEHVVVFRNPGNENMDHVTGFVVHYFTEESENGVCAGSWILLYINIT